MSPQRYLVECIKTEVKPSPINGVGTFALRDINKGEEIFPFWKGETAFYSVELHVLPKYIRDQVMKSYLNMSSDIVFFRLTEDCYWNLANPFAYLNTKEDDGNFCSRKRIALTDIKKGEEIFGTYPLEPTL